MISKPVGSFLCFLDFVALFLRFEFRNCLSCRFKPAKKKKGFFWGLNVSIGYWQVDDMTADFIISQLLFLDAEDPTKDIKLFINSPGGSVTAGTFSIILFSS